MTFSYYPYNRQELTLVQPQSIKYRAVYRSPMSSFRWNQEASQFLYDISKIYYELNNLQLKYQSYIDTLEEKATPSFNIEIYDTTLATPSLVGSTISSAETLAITLDALDKRLKRLEMRRNA